MTAAADSALLESRARELARAPVTPPGDTIEVVTFRLSGETYGVESKYVLEVVRVTDLAQLPGAQPPVLGITTWRGALLHVCDLRPILGLPSTTLDDLTRLIVLGRDAPAFGVLAQAVHDLVAVPAHALREPTEDVALRREYLRGVTAQAVIVLSAAKLLAIEI